ncbi:unnamed protein product [Allacma fusca]|uniref:CRAL-TRIO domain-containing protein n=1 Tax=Allacma fusca TaxID=39272 RepID=A0A8J2L5S0_9HEXA|nr:unnamed protein product [Allacma fusca]
MTLEETIKIVNGIETWDDPFNLKELLPYNLTGYDYEKRPVWMVDAGKLDFPSLAKKGQEAWATLEVFTVQAFLRAMKSTAALDSSSDEIREGLFVYDMETFRMEQLNHLQVLAEILRIVQKYNDLSLQLVGGIIILNSNYATQVAVSLVRPLVGRLMEKVEIYGNNRNIWLPRLLKHFSVDILPPQYGGSTNFKPLAEYG